MTTAILTIGLALAGAGLAPALEAAIRRTITLRTTAGATPPAVAPAEGRHQRLVGIAAITAALEATAALRLGATEVLALVAVFLPGLVALAWCDAEYYVLPKRIVHASTVAVCAAVVGVAVSSGEWHRAIAAACCGAVSFAVFLAINLVSPRAMAFGDVRLAGVIGLAVGWLGVGRVVTAFAIASLAAAVVAVALLCARRITLRSRLPFGVFLALGAVVALLG